MESDPMSFLPSLFLEMIPPFVHSLLLQFLELLLWMASILVSRHDDRLLDFHSHQWVCFYFLQNLNCRLIENLENLIRRQLPVHLILKRYQHYYFLHRLVLPIPMNEYETEENDRKYIDILNSTYTRLRIGWMWTSIVRRWKTAVSQLRFWLILWSFA